MLTHIWNSSTWEVSQDRLSFRLAWTTEQLPATSMKLKNKQRIMGGIRPGILQRWGLHQQSKVSLTCQPPSQDVPSCLLWTLAFAGLLVSSSGSLPWDSLYCYQSRQSSGTCSVKIKSEVKFKTSLGFGYYERSEEELWTDMKDKFHFNYQVWILARTLVIDTIRILTELPKWSQLLWPGVSIYVITRPRPASSLCHSEM